MENNKKLQNIKNKNIKNIIINNLRWIIMLIFIIMFFAILDDVMDEEIYSLDVKGYNFVTMGMNENLTVVAKVVTRMASPIILALFAFILLATMKNKKIKYTAIINLAMAALLNFLIKNIIQRPRPVGHRLIDESGYSFPSGHSMVSMAFYGYFIYLINKNVKSKKTRILATIGLTCLIVSIGLSRIYLGVHYTSDVLGGFCIAVSYLMVYTGVIKWLSKNRQKK